MTITAEGQTATREHGYCAERDGGHVDVVTYNGAIKCCYCGDQVGWVPCDTTAAHADFMEDQGSCDHCGEFLNG